MVIREIETGRWDICSWREIELESERGGLRKRRKRASVKFWRLDGDLSLSSADFRGLSRRGGGNKGRREPHELTVMKEFTFFRARKWYFAEWAPPEIFS